MERSERNEEKAIKKRGNKNTKRRPTYGLKEATFMLNEMFPSLIVRYFQKKTRRKKGKDVSVKWKGRELGKERREGRVWMAHSKKVYDWWRKKFHTLIKH
jgi:hypothetical protein